MWLLQYQGSALDYSQVYVGQKRGLNVSWDSLVDELVADSEGLGHVAQGQGAVGLQQLAIGLDPHLPHVVAVVRREQPILLHLLLHRSCGGEAHAVSNAAILDTMSVM